MIDKFSSIQIYELLNKKETLLGFGNNLNNFRE